MKTNTEIEIKKIRKQLQQHENTEQAKEHLRKKLSELKEIAKMEKV